MRLLDIRVFNPLASSNRSLSLPQCFQSHEKDRWSMVCPLCHWYSPQWKERGRHWLDVMCAEFQLIEIGNHVPPWGPSSRPYTDINHFLLFTSTDSVS